MNHMITIDIYGDGIRKSLFQYLELILNIVYIFPKIKK
jgi:hypothetical protein